MAFTYDLTTDIGKVRIKLPDTREEAAWGSDAEIQAALDDGGTVNLAVVYLARVLHMDRARRSASWSNSEGSYNDSGQIAALQALIEQYGGAADLASVSIAMPSLLPMDAGYDESTP